MPEYDRYWDLHLTGSTGWYDFAGQVETQRKYQIQAHRDKLSNFKEYISVPADCARGGRLVPMEPLDFAASPAGLSGGYVCTAAKITDIHQKATNDAFRTITRWISDTEHVGKLRVNCHGDPRGGGYIFMGTAPRGDPNRKQDVTLAGHIANWLIANGMQTPEKSSFYKNAHAGLVTVNLCICYSAKAGDGDNGLMSGVEQLTKVFSENEMFGITTTGVSHPSAVRPSEEQVRAALASEQGDDETKRQAGDEYLAALGNSKPGQSGFMLNGKWTRLAHSDEKVRSTAVSSWSFL